MVTMVSMVTMVTMVISGKLHDCRLYRDDCSCYVWTMALSYAARSIFAGMN